MRRPLLLASAVASSLLATLGLGACSTPPVADELTVVLLPHPDDEFQVWSQIEQRPGARTVFVLMTRGEQSGFCDSEIGGGRWTQQCSRARIDSWLTFFERMGASDPTIPSDLGEPQRVEGIDPQDANPMRDDDGTLVPSTAADVWQDAQGRGTLVAFDLGDGDLTTAEVEWAVRAVLDDRDAFGIGDLPVGRMLGAYSYDGDVEGCYPYPHPDHAAVATTLADVDLGARSQSWSTCSLDPATGAGDPSEVSDAAATAAFGPDGAFPAAYGWLGPWPLDDGQAELFHRQQAFATR
ncbi:hypothetical protein [Agrococcus sp. SGAir0287]|uniref:hypothetical protein n=1 Tax=Agrococcus sp. SGAir0287 TaxID=2070347 RepID=UPI0010CD07C0|nr:hypothetical protein [Agrococcus sp. SGAir0287]QCR18657.1 hypothetical protein C1N71_03655 [Agrococcus sp. SGAir0287]